MRDSKILITGYQNMDLDAVASAYAYAEFLNKKNIPALAGIFGCVHREVNFVFDKFNLQPLPDANLIKWHKVILVDASDHKWLSPRLDLGDVIEVIDHRQMHGAVKFKNAKIHLELVGAAATLIAEKFYIEKVPLSLESAALLYSAIIANTINCKANVATKKDIQLAEWLKTKFTLPPNYIHQMFAYKSEFDQSIEKTALEFMGIHDFNQQRVGIVSCDY